MSDEPRDESHLLWETLGSESLHDARIFSVRTVHRRSPRGTVAPFVVVDAPDWVTVIAEDTPPSGRRCLMVRQYRHGTERVGEEFPAGIVDPGEEPLHAAMRELREETGYRAAEWLPLGAVSPNPAFMTNTSYTFLARGLTKVGEQELDRHEILDYRWTDHARLAASMGRPPYDSAITVHAWQLYLAASAPPNKSYPRPKPS